MKKFVSLVLSMLLVFSFMFCNVAFADKEPSEVKTYANENAMVVVYDDKTDIREVLPNGDVQFIGYKDVRLCAFKSQYCCILADRQGTMIYGIWFFGKSDTWVILDDYTPVFFDDDCITLKKGDIYYEVDMEKTASTGELVVHPEKEIVSYDIATEIKTYGAGSALVIVKGNKTVIKDVLPNGVVRSYAFKDVRICAFTPQYLGIIIDVENSSKQAIWFFGGSDKMVDLEDYTPIFFDDYSITLKKGNTYYEVDMEETAATGKLVVNTVD